MKTWILLDFDNTLMATEHLAVPSLIARFNVLYQEQLGRPLTFEEFKQHFHGQAREVLCSNISKHFGIDVDYPTLYEKREWRMMEMLQKEGVEMAPNLLETLETLQTKYRFAFVSNNPIQRGLAAMRYAHNGQGEKLARLFGTAFFEAGEVQKPHPGIYLHAIAQLGISSKECYAVEDSITGVKAACASNISTFGYVHYADNPQKRKEELLQHGAIACFTDWKDFPYLIKETE